MERQSGLGRSLGDVLDSLAPVDPDPAGPGRVLFEPEDLEQQLDSLMGDIRELRDRVQHLVALVPEQAAEPAGPAEPAAHGKKKSSKKKHKKHKAKKHKKSKQAKKRKHHHSKAHAKAA
jgi:hypothetical protein